MPNSLDRMSLRVEPSDSQNDSEFQTEGSLTQNGFADKASAMRGTDSRCLTANLKVHGGA